MKFYYFVILALVPFLSNLSAVHAQPITRTKVSLQSDIAQLGAGSTFQIAVQFQIPPKTHIYWMNPGDSGEATHVQLKLPEGFTAGPVEFPTPFRIETGGNMVSFGYENQMTMLTRVTASKSIQPGEIVTIDATIEWMECDDKACMPGSKNLNLKLVVGDKSEPVHGVEFAEYRRQIPVKLGDAGLADSVKFVEAGEGVYRLEIHWKQDLVGITFFPPPEDQMKSNVISAETREKVTTVVLKSKAVPGSLQKSGQALVSYRNSEGQTRGLIVPIYLENSAKN